MILLAIDTSANLCAASIQDTTERGRAVHDLGKGHAEHLMAVIDEALAQAGVAFADLDAVAVSVGPGSFTGIRVGVSAARGLALALGIPAIGVTTLEALGFEARQANPGRAILAALDGGRGEIHAALYSAAGDELAAPAAFDAKAALALASEHDAVVTGSSADILQALADGTLDVAGRAATADIAAYAALAATKPVNGPRPSPLYLRSADAKVQEGFAVSRKGGS
ncbi:tRNA (adenosine(37)-N6)-threonylcarbamoyltransferase complex dimerization subunit type 1 TsaB [Aliihoeflea aestuarii]|jgi:tRNA threonylcarbamoyladenosine biosynthesis protein TsaB|uniref:tRNA (adenosine(37)-N6)-threonylcarbamoyltransferase complex dimerization subunit type 1 TsaB n=1 Tax=Aliihoeflea aestuarii TaxID=453840 RepID=UPI002091EC80|nr:tRNA (adenosine(37)-N6)-threonylcarbamoyltransferase complex dimerization subunit type 1 TsaB [Aliihoeflea aestuarii]MCO6391508.1 tRNA (adenosine(37)-N6)-threonylcarbamoyltransferase complex dimerization subunit type 1 TsaB [Aliihoeflea aestuarii]